jgi:hypothetical protein
LYPSTGATLRHRLAWKLKYSAWKIRGEMLLRRSGASRASIPPPVLVGATGGSGTRAVARVLGRAGLFMGSNLNFADDAVDFIPFIVRWVPKYLERLSRSESAPELRGMDRDIEIAVAMFRQTIPGTETPWGAKGPRFIYILPQLDRQLSGMRFIHLVRDGRDMAFAPNQSQLNDYGKYLLDPGLSDAPEPVRSIALWDIVNRNAADYGVRVLGERYLRIRFEDLCAEPVSAITQICRFAGAQTTNLSEAVAEIKPQDTTGRFKDHNPQLLEAMTRTATAGLKLFGYIT